MLPNILEVMTLIQLKTSKPQCEPYYYDWGEVGLIHVYGSEIIPSSEYFVQAIEEGYDTQNETYYSESLQINTSRWGDLVSGSCSSWTAPDGIVDFMDITAVADKFKNLPTAPIKVRCDISSNIPDQKVDFVDISYITDAFKEEPYPFTGPENC
ncbi:unnamed protein product [marine sediment metagenome]|uniref:Uncharacterized protein n=1 Tax=marine sediment metagenome TaxID=412755 RepID=X1J3E0_9ZZZZ